MLIEMSCINKVYLSLYCNLWVGALDAGEMLLILCLYMHVYIYICLSVCLSLIIIIYLSSHYQQVLTYIISTL